MRSGAVERIGDHPRAAAFLTRFDRHAPLLHALLTELYGEPHWVERAVESIADGFLSRPDALHRLDEERVRDPNWFRRHSMVGAVAYVDRFADTLRGVKDHIPYLEELGITYLHLMPVYARPDGPNDGGYAVSSYRDVHPPLGTIDDLVDLAARLRTSGISLSLDFVFNHTAADHAWARAAINADERYHGHYFIFPDRTMPDRYDATLREIFPDEHRGSFTQHHGKWVWTTFHDYQWDLNYGNPQVFVDILSELLFLANRGAEILRLDAVAFIAKQLGTSCENLPEAHTLVRAFNAAKRIAAPALIFKSEAIVAPEDVVRYFGTGEHVGEECEIAYHPLLMAGGWQAISSGDARLLTESMRRHFHVPGTTAWVNYVRSHDDIGWGFADDDARDLGMDPRAERDRLNAFYTGGGWARGLEFQANPLTGDKRISGTAASLAGLEAAFEARDGEAVAAATDRIVLLHGIAIAIAGIPLLYLGDEIAQLNDYSYREVPDEAGDSRWVHRPQFDWERAALRHDPSTPVGQVWERITRLLALRRAEPACGAVATTTFLDVPDALFAFQQRAAGGDGFVFVANVADRPIRWKPLATHRRDRIRDEQIGDEDELAPYQIRWLAP